MKLTYRDKIMLIGAVVVILWAIGIFVIIKPAFSTMDEKSKLKDSKDNEVVILQQRVDAEKNLKDDLQKAYDAAVEHSEEYFYKVDTKENVTDKVRELLYTSKRKIVNTDYKIDDMTTSIVTPYEYNEEEVLSSLEEQIKLISDPTAANQVAAADAGAAMVLISISTYGISSDYECTLDELLAFADSLETTDQQSFIIQTVEVEDVNETGKIQGEMTFNYYMAPEIPRPSALGPAPKSDSKDKKDSKDDSSSEAS